MEDTSEHESPLLLGQRVRELRERLELTQAELGKRAGLTQSYISRLEGSEHATPSVKAIAELARALDETPRDLTAGTETEHLFQSDNQGDAFRAYCPNPFCRDNHIGWEDGVQTVRWSSFRRYSINEFSEINYCGYCGEEILKQCPQCNKLIESANQQYCVKCQASLNERPTEDDWVKIRRSLGTEEAKIEPAPGEDIPF